MPHNDEPFFLLLKEKKSVVRKEEKKKEQQLSSRIHMNDITFAWGCPPSSPYISVVNRVSFSANAGDLVVITGPTCSGKTELSLKLASSLSTEIISADSMQVYKGFDIGTAKPEKGILSSIKHHLINI